jgi:hypothetical protein
MHKRWTNSSAQLLAPMIIATRILTLRTGGKDRRIEVRLFAPKQDRTAWLCRYEIDWPEGTQVMEAGGADAMQALIIALHMIGSDIYTSDYHKSGSLFFWTPGEGYGFPVPANLRDLLIGNDLKYGA